MIRHSSMPDFLLLGFLSWSPTNLATRYSDLLELIETRCQFAFLPVTLLPISMAAVNGGEAGEDEALPKMGRTTAMVAALDDGDGAP
ncbi:hypothetical protein ACLOJK_016334 [Asimina triloba]